MAMHVNSSVLEMYLSGDERDPTRRRIRSSSGTYEPHFDVAIKYTILMLALRRDFRTWVCAIDAKRDSVSVRCDGQEAPAGGRWTESKGRFL
jgi:hypothetical protein